MYWLAGRRKEGKDVILVVQPGLMLVSSPSGTDKKLLELDIA